MLPQTTPNPDPKGRVPRSQVGFTLIELIVVIIIVGILAGFAVMSLNRTEPNGVDVCQAHLQDWLAQQAVQADQAGATVYIAPERDTLMSFILSLRPLPPAANRAEPPAAAGHSPTAGAGVDVANERLQRDPLDHLHWAADCRVVPGPSGVSASTPARPMAPDDPRASALLAVTDQGHWSAPTGAPVLEIRGRDQHTRTLDLAPAADPASSSRP